MTSDENNKKCPYYDDGWCYASESNHNSCPDTWRCDYFQKVVRKEIYNEKQKEIDDIFNRS